MFRNVNKITYNYRLIHTDGTPIGAVSRYVKNSSYYVAVRNNVFTF